MRNRGIRLFAVGVAAASLVTIAGTPAIAAPKVTCSKATFKTDLKKFTSTSKISGCTNAAVSGGGGTIVANFKNLKKITAKITWNGGKGTTSYAVTQVQDKGPQSAKCKITKPPTRDVLIVSTGKFKSGTGAVGTALKGAKYVEKLCVKSTNSATYLLPGSKITFG